MYVASGSNNKLRQSVNTFLDRKNCTVIFDIKKCFSVQNIEISDDRDRRASVRLADLAFLRLVIRRGAARLVNPPYDGTILYPAARRADRECYRGARMQAPNQIPNIM